ncbi:uncharacterized protein LOC116592692 [Mustela erminea]|uniref:uncharacterized protein LOC116592692 n=1 Tax=Mustela erminea TaxID=36723 RepID=UPI001387653D|nr:uncharacterized protein LOC116592692 [Mustela erminea]
MVFGLGCQRERLYKPLYTAHLFILAENPQTRTRTASCPVAVTFNAGLHTGNGVVYYYFQGPVGKTAPDHDMAEEPSQLEGETLRPVWGPMDKCYPGTTQRRRVKSGKKQASEARTPKATGGLSSAAPTEETELWSQRAGEVRPPEEEAGSLGPVAKEREAAGTPGWEVSRDVGQESVAHPPEVSEEDSEEERPGGWVPQLLQKLWLDWFPAPDIPKTQNHE